MGGTYWPNYNRFMSNSNIYRSRVYEPCFMSERKIWPSSRMQTLGDGHLPSPVDSVNQFQSHALHVSILRHSAIHQWLPDVHIPPRIQSRQVLIPSTQNCEQAGAFSHYVRSSPEALQHLFVRLLYSFCLTRRRGTPVL